MGACLFPQRRRRRLDSIALALAATTSTACATLLVGTHQDVLVRSDPPGATASAPGAGSVQTPAKLSIERLRPGEVTFSAEGYQPVSREIGREIHPLVLGNVFILILPGLVVDFVFGGAYRLDKEVFVRLERLPQESDAHPSGEETERPGGRSSERPRPR